MEYKAFHKLSYGLYIIASEFEGKKNGYVGNTVFQITSKPPKLAISCHKENFTVGIIQKSKIFSISVLKQECSTSLIGSFGFMSGSEIDKFKNVNLHKAVTGAPIVPDGSLAWFDCRVTEEVDAGSHILFVGEVMDSKVTASGVPLTYDYYREKYKMLSPKNAPTFLEKEILDKEEEKTVMPEESTVKESGSSYVCAICGYEYNPAEGDPALGIAPGTAFEDLPEDYKCPICNAGKDFFNQSE